MPFGAELIMSNPKMFRYEWIWKKNLGTGFLNANRMPLKAHENILVFYKSLPIYNPQKWQSTPYRATSPRAGLISSYGHFKDQIRESKDGSRFPLDVLKFRMPYANGNETVYHPTQKPVDLLEYLIKTYTNEGELVLDNCIGSGSTAVACIETNRNFIGFETDKNYFEIANKRINKTLEDKEMRLAL